jgi:hypothetical protein
MTTGAATKYLDRRAWRKLTPSEQSSIIRSIVQFNQSLSKSQIAEACKRHARVFNSASKIFIVIHRDQIKFAAALWRNDDFFPGLIVNHLVIHQPSTDRIDLKHVRHITQMWRRSINSHCIMALSSSQFKMLPAFAKIGFGVEFVVLRGDTSKSLTSLRTRLKTHPHPPDDIEIKPLLDARHIKDIRRLKLREFRRNPQYGWMITSPKYLNPDIARIKAELIKGRKDHWGIFYQGKMRGYFGVAVHGKQKPAGVELVFDVSMQGKGLASIAYRMMFERLSQLKIKHYQGGTSHPAVLKVGSRLKREPIAVVLRWGQFENHQAILNYLKRRG